MHLSTSWPQTRDNIHLYTHFSERKASTDIQYDAQNFHSNIKKHQYHSECP
ncbi:hypothetical protein I79_001813 [Cricetulus griseus]|uniref:Uncharacterized protein n=1 Tax=Cricetulus griseus TaxID=10029 RepID=G3GVR6_CRIGR|nr:hypothetical protein I79_001813 [Cricetulus griseus]